MNPGDTRLDRGRHVDRTHAQRRPGMNPGDTRAVPNGDTSVTFAQRRPRDEPRRHASSRQSSLPEAESAQRRPGDEPRRHPAAPARERSSPGTLNEGWGMNPGDTWTAGAISLKSWTLNEGRGMNPGDTRRHTGRSRGPVRRRSTRPGMNPATPSRRGPSRAASPALNEGRGMNPGDTVNWMLPFVDGISSRSTKAGG